MYRIATLSVHTCPLATLGGKETGGMNVYVRELTRELGRRGIKVDVFTRAIDPDIAWVRDMGPNARVIHLKAGPVAPCDKNEIYNYLPQFIAGVEKFRAQENLRYDLVHAHYWVSGEAGVQLAETWGVPLVQMFHTLGQMKNQVAKTDLDREVGLRIETEMHVADLADRIIAPTSTERAQLAWYYGADPEKISVIPCGVDTQLFRPRDQHASRQRLNLPCGRLLLFVGRIERLKGIDTLLESAALLMARPGYEDLRVLIVGGDLESNRDNIELHRVQQRALDLGIRDRVDFLGPQPQAELPYFYSAADLTIMPSHYESFGMVALESMACGTPVVASRVGGLAQLVRDGETGILVPEEEPTALAMQIHATLQNDAEREAMGTRAAEYARGFDWGTIADRVVGLYDELIHDVAVRECPYVM
ncbi:MAG: glycosyltransferase [Chloroflexia bacterium]